MSFQERWNALGYKVFRPTVLMIMITLINITIYFDRGVISAVLQEVARYWEINNTLQGFLASAFIVGFMLFCPISAAASSYIRPTFIMAFGLFVFSVSTFLCAVSGLTSRSISGYYMLVASRALTGVGEASFAALAPTIIDDIAHPKVRTTYLAVFYMSQPVGVGLGYGVTAGLIKVSWRLPFLIESVIVLVLSLLCFLVPSPDYYKRMKNNGNVINSQDEVDVKKTTNQNIGLALLSIFSNPTYVFSLFGSTAYVFVVGAFTFWAPTLISASQKISTTNANIGFSIIALCTGILGGLMGGLTLDRLGGSQGFRGSSRAAFLCASCLIVGFGFGVGCFLTSNYIIFFALLAPCTLFTLAITSPNSSIFLTVVKPEMRNLSMGIQMMCIHLFGDFPSPVLFGMLADAFGGKRRGLVTAFYFLWSVILLSILFYIFAGLVAKSKAILYEKIDRLNDNKISNESDYLLNKE
ncbi:sphingolipid transporter spinster [Acrasis kona]|uniref:Sphingolipid transporter spinster n=1 Tax=Acrasis kona TaxID=1008807 RepID=A0AAW2ZMD0_9EUKA